jgi:hypothetical protein
MEQCFLMRKTYPALFLAAAICAGSCNSSDGLEDVDGASSSTGSIGFDREKEGALPASWRVGATNPGRESASWSVRGDAAAPSLPNVVSLTKTNHTSQDAFNLCWTDQVQFADGALEVAVRADGGEIDQGGGPIWRVRDANNYYVCRFNPLESNFRVYVVKDGSRVQLATALVETHAGEWHRVRVEHVGSRIACSLDGHELLQAEDETFAAGGVGFWTKADARTSFDDLRLP